MRRKSVGKRCIIVCCCCAVCCDIRHSATYGVCMLIRVRRKNKQQEERNFFDRWPAAAPAAAVAGAAVYPSALARHRANYDTKADTPESETPQRPSNHLPASCRHDAQLFSVGELILEHGPQANDDLSTRSQRVLSIHLAQRAAGPSRP